MLNEYSKQRGALRRICFGIFIYLGGAHMVNNILDEDKRKALIGCIDILVNHPENADAETVLIAIEGISDSLSVYFNQKILLVPVFNHPVNQKQVDDFKKTVVEQKNDE